MPKYDVLLFDIDDTLLDFQANERNALNAVFRKMKIPLNDNIRATYTRLNKELWERYERGHLDKKTVVNSRFKILFEGLGVHVDGEKIESIYQKELGNGAQLIDGAKEVCRRLSKHYKLVAVTNGAYLTQMRRLKASGLYRFMEEIFISETVGFQKPSKEFFHYVFVRIRPDDLARVLIIGDSVSSDMQGGINAGIDTCWFNPSGRRDAIETEITYKISSLFDLYAILYEKQDEEA